MVRSLTCGGCAIVALLVAGAGVGRAAPVRLIDAVKAGDRAAIQALLRQQADVNAADPDGTTLLFTPDFLMTLYPHSFKKLSYDPLTDFVPIQMVARSGLALAAGPALPLEVKTVREYVDWVRANPARSHYATTAAGGTPHFVGVMLARDAKVSLTPVHYKGGAPALNDLVGGHIELMMVDYASAAGQIHAGKIRLLAAATAERISQLPDVPTIR